MKTIDVYIFLPHLSWKHKRIWMIVCLSTHHDVLCLQTFHIFIFSYRITGPNSTKHGLKHPWVVGIEVSSKEGPRPLPRGDKRKIAKIHWQHLNIFISTPKSLGQFQPDLAWSILWWRGFKFDCENTLLIFKHVQIDSLQNWQKKDIQWSTGILYLVSPQAVQY